VIKGLKWKLSADVEADQSPLARRERFAVRTIRRQLPSQSNEVSRMAFKFTSKEEIADYVMLSAQLASLIEISEGPKPGSVSRTADLPLERAGLYEHFVAGAVAIGPAVREATLRGVEVGQNKLEVSEIGIGRYIKQALQSVKRWHCAGDTHSGPVLLFIPLAAAAGKTFAETGEMGLKDLRGNVKLVTRSTTPQDAVDVYEIMAMACSPKEIGHVTGERAPDLYDKDAKRKLLEEGISLYDTMKAADWDDFCREWVNGMKISFEIGYPTLVEIFEEAHDINTATVHTFLTILSKFEFGDTCIARWVGLKETDEVREAVTIGAEKAKWISDRASLILKLGGLKTKEGIEELGRLDEALRQGKGESYPATAADLTASSLFIAILHGLRF